jgi:peroxiredoxin
MLGKLTPLWLMTQGAAERARSGTNNPWISVFGCTWPSSEFYNQPKTLPEFGVESFWPDGFAHFAEIFEFPDPQDPGTTLVQQESFKVVGWTNWANVKLPAGFAASAIKKARSAISAEPKLISEARFTFVTIRVDPGPVVRWETRAPRLSTVGDMRPFERGELPNGLSYNSTNGIIYLDPVAESKQRGLRVIPLVVRTPKPGGPRVGSLAPDFKVKTLDGADHKLTDLRGKYVLLNFWATWCGPCLGEIPDLKATYDEFAKNGDLVMVGLSLDDKREQLISFVGNKGIGWPQAMLAEGFADPIAKSYGVDAIPSMFLVGPDGKFIFCYHSGHGINQAVASALSRKGIDRGRP